MLSKSLQLGLIHPSQAKTRGLSLFARLRQWLGVVPLDPPREFAKTLRLHPQVCECPLCGNEVMECDCQWSAQG